MLIIFQTLNSIKKIIILKYLILFQFSKILRNTIVNCKNIFITKRFLKSIKMIKISNNSWPIWRSCCLESVTWVMFLIINYFYWLYFDGWAEEERISARGWRTTYLGAKIKNDVSRCKNQERRISVRGCRTMYTRRVGTGHKSAEIRPSLSLIS